MMGFIIACVEKLLMAYFPLCLIWIFGILVFDKKWVVRNKVNDFVCKKHPMLHEVISLLFSLSMLYHFYNGFVNY